MSLHAGENFDKSEYGLHTSYGDYKYFYDYLGDGEFGVFAKIDIEEKDLTDQIIKELDNGKIRSNKDADRIIEMWKRNQRTTEDNRLHSNGRQSSLSNNGQSSGTVRTNSRSESSEDDRLWDVAIEADTYFKTGADGKNRPRYEKRYSLSLPIDKFPTIIKPKVSDSQFLAYS